MNFYRKIRNRVFRASMKGLATGPHITRYAMYQHLRQVGSRLPQQVGSLLSISHSTGLAEVLGITAEESVDANFPEHDILDLGFQDDQFDMVISDQVLEHVEGSPEQAIAECRRILKPGGIAVHTTCLINPIHKVPGDFWRFTPDGLALLHRDFSETIDCAGWGNQEVWTVVRDGLRFHGVPHAQWHPLHKIATHNDPLWPIVTWIVARK